MIRNLAGATFSDLMRKNIVSQVLKKNKLRKVGKSILPHLNAVHISGQSSKIRPTIKLPKIRL